jgi:hypothetical protein
VGLANIRAALAAAYESLDLHLDTAHENRPFKPGNSPWASLFLAPNAPAVATLGDGGEDEHTGFLQIDLNYPQHTGTAGVLETADKIRAYFVAGRRLVYDGQEVLIRSSGRTAGVNVDGWYRVSMTIFWTARTNRSL